MMQFRSPSGTAEPEIVERPEPRVRASRMSTHNVGYDVDSGRKANVCVQELTNDAGRVVGCARYEETAITERRERSEPIRVFTTASALRWCAPTKRLVTSDTPWVEVSYDDLGTFTTVRIELEGGRKVSGAWGGRGGRDALAELAGGPAADTGRPAPSAPTGPGPAAEPSRGTVLKLQPVQLADKKGAVVVVLTPEGKVLIDGRLFARVFSDGHVETKDGTTVLKLDATGALTMVTGTRAVPVGSVSAGTLSAKGGQFTLDGDYFRYRADGRDRRSGLRIEKTTASPTLLLLLAYLLSPTLQFSN